MTDDKVLALCQSKDQASNMSDQAAKYCVDVLTVSEVTQDFNQSTYATVDFESRVARQVSGRVRSMISIDEIQGLTRLLITEGPKLVHVGVGQAFRDDIFYVLDALCSELHINFAMGSRTAFKGRLMLYGGVDFRPTPQFVDCYERFRLEPAQILEKKITSFRVAYLRFKKKPRVHMIKKRASKKNSILNLVKLVLLAISKGYFFDILNSLFSNKSLSGNYVVVLLNKSNTWKKNVYNHRCDEKRYIELLLDACGSKKKIIVIDHPLVSSLDYSRLFLHRLCRKNKNLVYINGGIPSYDLIEKAERILFFNSTAGIESFLLSKPIAQLGWRMPYFRFRNAPVRQLSSYWSVQQFLNDNEIGKERLAYILACLETSVNFDDSREWDRITEESQDNTFETLGKLIGRYYLFVD